MENAPFSYSEDSSGLHIGVQSALVNQWAGYYAARNEGAQLFHAVLSLPSTTIPGNKSFNTGLYVQTGGINVNYVTCAGGVDTGGYYWSVVEATGNPNQATQYNTLWFEWMNGQPLTRTCTIVTNGANMLSVYMDGSLVFSSTSMNLGYQSPFITFLEVQATDNTVMHFSTYTDYYSTSTGYVTVNGAPPGSTVEAVSASGTVLASGQAGTSGTATLGIAQYEMPLQATIEVNALGVIVASTTGPVQLYGGDVYAVGGSPGGLSAGATPTTGVFTIVPGNSQVVKGVGQGIQIDAGSASAPSAGAVCILGLCL